MLQRLTPLEASLLALDGGRTPAQLLPLTAGHVLRAADASGRSGG